MNLLHTLLELGHSTSRNLGLSYSLSPNISFGEETITEMNLLEIQRRHPKLVRIETFSKLFESSKTGADWEWHLIGRSWTLKLRVQAKRITKSGVLKGIFRTAKTSQYSQVDLLIESALRDGLRPIYCFYCAERHRNVWSLRELKNNRQAFEAGCLLAPAGVVRSIMPTTLSQIEPHCRPWHHLWSNADYAVRKGPSSVRFQDSISIDRYYEEVEALDHTDRKYFVAEWELPSANKLNN